MQAARDAPLVPGKPTVARIYANWPKYPDIAAQAQVRAFDARVVGREDTPTADLSVLHTFTRPDLWEHLGVDQAQAEHTADLFGWVPEEKGSRRSLQFDLELRREGEWRRHARVRCPVQVWDHSPGLVVDWYMAPVGEWEDDGHYADLEAARRVVAAAETMAWQQLPFSKVEFRERGVLPVREGSTLDLGNLCSLGFQTVDCLPLDMKALGDLDHTAGSADAIVTFVPLEDLSGGGAKDKIVLDDPGAQSPGRILIGLDTDPIFEGYATMGVVHELGHTFLLEHKPYLGSVWDPELRARNHLRDMRLNRALFTHKGIEGFKISRDGKRGWNKSSSEGNGESESMAPLMFPISLQPEHVFIGRDHYLDLLDILPRSSLFPDVELDGSE